MKTESPTNYQQQDHVKHKFNVEIDEYYYSAHEKACHALTLLHHFNPYLPLITLILILLLLLGLMNQDGPLQMTSNEQSNAGIEPCLLIQYIV